MFEFRKLWYQGEDVKKLVKQYKGSRFSMLSSTLFSILEKFAIQDFCFKYKSNENDK